MLNAKRLRPLVARIASDTGTYTAVQWACGRIAGGFVLAYHDLASEIFEAQVDALRPNQPIHLSELLARKQTNQSTAGLFAITLDDGVSETVRTISAVCKNRGWPITFYLPTAYVDEDRGLPFQLWSKIEWLLPQTLMTLPSVTLDLSTQAALARFKAELRKKIATQSRAVYEPLIEEMAAWLVDREFVTADQLRLPEAISWSEVAELSKDDVIHFESHGMTHTAVVALSEAALIEELNTSKSTISEHTNRECEHFCYPFGGEESIGKLAPKIISTFYKSGVTMSRGRLADHPACLLPRIPVYGEDDPDVVRLKILTV